MSGKLNHRGYSGSVLYSSEDKVLHGRLLHIRDMVTYEGVDGVDLEKNFEDAIEEYLKFCVSVGKSPDVPQKPAPRVRIPSELQARAASFARIHDRTLQTVVQEALEGYLATQKRAL